MEPELFQLKIGLDREQNRRFLGALPCFQVPCPTLLPASELPDIGRLDSVPPAGSAKASRGYAQSLARLFIAFVHPGDAFELLSGYFLHFIPPLYKRNGAIGIVSSCLVLCFFLLSSPVLDARSGRL